MELFYQNMLQQIRNHPILENTIISFTKYIPIITFIIYPSILIYLFITKNTLLFTTIIKPLASFVIVTIFRKIINRKRPYEAMNIEPLLTHKAGESFPSRHTVSAFAIALACLNVYLPLGIIMLILAFIVSFSRILCGVHYISDVICAILIAIFVAIL
ncbi:phosphatase PAP2 family protein [Thomasclavelia saccharogumia]|uniref:phosphatase PAP2 family protein n=1 Tax=Thomasclavelia saccharogumia TaxID=341225 RepID=UPI0004794A87|nr:phosphatase PAP2 family protein [Thomasclavelia saccharogumia]